MKKHPSEFSVVVWFCGGPDDDGLHAQAFKIRVERMWPHLVPGKEVNLDHLGMGQTHLDNNQNWKLAFPLMNASGTHTAEALDAILLGMIAEQKPTQTVQFEITSKWQYGA